VYRLPGTRYHTQRLQDDEDRAYNGSHRLVVLLSITKECHMPKYLFQANYVGAGVKGLLKEGGASRRAAVEKAAQSLGGTLEAFYYAFGDTDAYVVVDLPDNATATALALTVNSSGVAVVKTTVLMTPEEVDAAVKKNPSYRAPGQ
jgi:uncharacterized protein with GYD domain